jgi:hypothetical protein
MKVIGILTIIMAIVSFLIPYRLSTQGVWGGYTGSLDIFVIYAVFPYFGMIMVVAGLVIGIATLRRKKWTWKGNIIFQLVSIPLIVGSLATPFLISAEPYDFVVLPFHHLVLLILSIVILSLLLRTKAREEYSLMSK